MAFLINSTLMFFNTFPPVTPKQTPLTFFFTHMFTPSFLFPCSLLLQRPGFPPLPDPQVAFPSFTGPSTAGHQKGVLGTRQVESNRVAYKCGQPLGLAGEEGPARKQVWPL